MHISCSFFYQRVYPGNMSKDNINTFSCAASKNHRNPVNFFLCEGNVSFLSRTREEILDNWGIHFSGMTTAWRKLSRCSCWRGFCQSAFQRGDPSLSTWTSSGDLKKWMLNFSTYAKMLVSRASATSTLAESSTEYQPLFSLQKRRSHMSLSAIRGHTQDSLPRLFLGMSRLLWCPHNIWLIYLHILNKLNFLLFWSCVS